MVAYSCAVVAGGFSVFNLMLGINWMVHFASVLRLLAHRDDDERRIARY